MTVPAETQELQVEHRVVELSLVVGGGLLPAELALDAVDGARAALEPVEQRSLRERVVREVVVRRNAAFVAPPDLRLAPVGLALGCFRVRKFRCRPTCQRDVSTCARRAPQLFRDRRSDLVRVLEDDELDVARQGSPAASSFDRSIAA